MKNENNNDKLSKTEWLIAIVISALVLIPCIIFDIPGKIDAFFDAMGSFLLVFIIFSIGGIISFVGGLFK